MIYIPISSIEAAEFLSRQLYKLTRPAEVREENDVTEFYCGWHVHPETSAVVVALPETETVPVHVSADTTLLDPLLLPFVEQGAITEDDRAAIRTLIAESQGGQVNLVSLLPAFWAAQAMTQEQVEAAGWFAVEEEI